MDKTRLREITSPQGCVINIQSAIQLLRDARDLLVVASAPNAAQRVRSALTSAEGALRNAQAHRNDPPDRLRRGASKRKAVRHA